MKKFLVLLSVFIASDAFCAAVGSNNSTPTNSKTTRGLGRAIRYVKASEISSKASVLSPNTGKELVQTFNEDGSYYWLDSSNKEKWVYNDNGVLVIYEEDEDVIIPLLGVNLAKAVSACSGISVDNYTGKFNLETNDCEIPVVATNWSGDITKNGQIVMTYSPMGTQFVCNKESFEQVNALRRSSQWVVPLLVGTGAGVGYGIDYALDKKRKEEQEKVYSNVADIWREAAKKQQSLDKLLAVESAKWLMNEIRYEISFGANQTKQYITFGVDKYNLEDDDKKILDELVKVVGNKEVSITGHTSTTASNEYNRKLGMNRANVVANYLRGKGVVVNAERTGSAGEEYLIKPTDDEIEEEKNRAAVISFVSSVNESNGLSIDEKNKLLAKYKSYIDKWVPLDLSDDLAKSLEKSAGTPDNFWTKNGLSGAVIGGGVGAVAGLGFWAAEGASIHCNVGGLKDLKLKETYTIPSFKEYLIKNGWIN